MNTCLSVMCVRDDLCVMYIKPDISISSRDSDVSS